MARPAGMSSSTTTALAAALPVLVTTRGKVNALPATTVLADVDFVICSPGLGQETVTMTGFESTSPLLSALTCPVFVRGPQGPVAALVDTLIVSDFDAPGARSARLQVTACPTAEQPAVIA